MTAWLQLFALAAEPPSAPQVEPWLIATVRVNTGFPDSLKLPARARNSQNGSAAVDSVRCQQAKRRLTRAVTLGEHHVGQPSRSSSSQCTERRRVAARMRRERLHRVRARRAASQQDRERRSAHPPAYGHHRHGERAAKPIDESWSGTRATPRNAEAAQLRRTPANCDQAITRLAATANRVEEANV